MGPILNYKLPGTVSGLMLIHPLQVRQRLRVLRPVSEHVGAGRKSVLQLPVVGRRGVSGLHLHVGVILQNRPPRTLRLHLYPGWSVTAGNHRRTSR